MMVQTRKRNGYGTQTSGFMLAIMLLAFQVSAASVTWNNAEGTWRWNTSEENWTGGSTTFSPGDDVTFTTTAAGSVYIGTAGPTPVDVSPGSVLVNGNYTFTGGGLTGTGSLTTGWDRHVYFDGFTTDVHTFSGGVSNITGWLYVRPDGNDGTYSFGTGTIDLGSRGGNYGFLFRPQGNDNTLINDFYVRPGVTPTWRNPNVGGFTGNTVLGTVTMDGNLSVESHLAATAILTGNRTISGSNNSRITGAVDGAGIHALTLNMNGNQPAWTDWRFYVDDGDAGPAAWDIAGVTKTGTGNVVFSAPRDLGDELNLVTGAVVLGGHDDPTNLLRDTADVNMLGGKLYLRRNSTGSETETIGSLNLSSRHSEIILSTNAGETRTLAVTAPLVRQNHATALITTNNLGGTGGGSGSGQLTLPSAPTLIGGGGSAGSTDISIVPYLIGGTSTTDHTYVVSADRGSTFVTYDAATNSLRTLNKTTEFATSIDGVSGTTTNVRRTAAEALTADRTVNSLILDTTVGGSAFDLDMGGNTLTVDSGALMVRGNNGHTVNIGSSVGDGYLDFNGGEGIISTTSSWNYGGVTVKVNSVIQNGGLTKAGHSILELHADNTFTGPLAVNSGGRNGQNDDALYIYGTLATQDIRLYGSRTYLGDDDRLPTDSTPMINQGAVLNLNGNNQTLHGLQDGPDGGGSVTGSGTLTLDPVADHATGFSGSISGGGIHLVKDGPNRALLVGTVSPSQLILRDGTLRVNSRPGGSQHHFQGGILELPTGYRDWSYGNQVHFGPGGGGWSAQGGTVTIWISGSTPQEWGVSTGFILDGDPLMLNTTSSDSLVRYDSAINLGASGGSALREFRIGNNPNVTTDYAIMQGAVSGDAGYVLWKTGDGRLVLTNNGNSFSGGMQISGGTLEVADDRRLGAVPASPAVNITLDGGAFQFGANMTVNANRTIQLNSDTDGMIDTNGFTGTVPGLITGPGTLFKQGGGTLVLSGANDYTGGTRIDEGTLRVGNASALGNGGGVEMTGGTLDLRSFDVGIGPLSGSGGVITNQIAGTATLTTTSPVDTSSTFAGTITDNTGVVALTKAGPGTLNLTGPNTYSGATNVADGTLLVNGTTSGQGDYHVQAGATLGGTGTIGLAPGNSITVDAGGVFSPGNSIGTLNVSGDLVFNDGAVYLWEVDHDGYDSIAVDGDLVFGDSMTLTIDWLPGERRPEPQQFVLFSYTGDDPILPEWDIQYLDAHLMGATIWLNADTNQILMSGIIPEPTTAILLAVGAAMLLNRRRRANG